MSLIKKYQTKQISQEVIPAYIDPIHQALMNVFSNNLFTADYKKTLLNLYLNMGRVKYILNHLTSYLESAKKYTDTLLRTGAPIYQDELDSVISILTSNKRTDKSSAFVITSYSIPIGAKILTISNKRDRQDTVQISLAKLMDNAKSEDLDSFVTSLRQNEILKTIKNNLSLMHKDLKSLEASLDRFYLDKQYNNSTVYDRKNKKLNPQYEGRFSGWEKEVLVQLFDGIPTVLASMIDSYLADLESVYDWLSGSEEIFSLEQMDSLLTQIDELGQDQKRLETAIQEMEVQETVLSNLPEEDKQSETVQSGLQLARRAVITGLGIDPESEEGKEYIEEITSPVSTEDANKEGLGQKLIQGLKKIFETIMEKIKAFGAWVKKHATVFFKRSCAIIRKNSQFIVGAISAGSDMKQQLINFISTEDSQSSSNALMVSPYVYDFINNDFIDLHRYFDNRLPILSLLNAIRKQFETSPDQPLKFDTFKEWKESIYLPNQANVKTLEDLTRSQMMIGRFTEKERPITVHILDQIKQLEKYSENAEAKFDNWKKAFEQINTTITDLCDDIIKVLSQPDQSSNLTLSQYRLGITMLSQISTKLFNQGMKAIQHQKTFSEKLAKSVKSLSR